MGNSRYDSTIADHQLSIGGNSEQQINGRQTLVVGQGISLSTTTYELDASERLVIKGPGGSITLDAEGIHLGGLAITVQGPLTTTGKGQGNTSKLQLTSNCAQTCNEASE